MITNRARPGHDRALTRAESEFLQQLHFRRQQPEGVQGAFLFDLSLSRRGVIVRTMMNTYETSPRFTKNQRTLDALEAAGLIEIGPVQKLPDPFGPCGYGQPVTITQLGRQTIG